MSLRIDTLWVVTLPYPSHSQSLSLLLLTAPSRSQALTGYRVKTNIHNDGVDILSTRLMVFHV